MSLYKVHFKWKEKEISLSARSLDMTHPYFVSIKDLVFAENSKLIINPAEDEIRKTFMESNQIMIPFQTIILIEELPEKREKKEKREIRFPMKDKDTGGDEEDDRAGGGGDSDSGEE